MKKTAKNSQKKNAHPIGAARNIKKKRAKTEKITVKRAIKSLSIFHAFLLVGVMIVLSACISLAVIMVRLSIKKADVPEYDLMHEAIINPVTDGPDTVISLTLPETANPVPAMEQNAAIPSNTTTQITVTSVPQSQPQLPPERLQDHLGTLVFVIDDAGNNLRELEPFLNILSPLTIAVLPGLPNSAEAARRVRAAGKEVFLHQPMEAIGAQNPGPGAIYSGMSASEIRSILERNIAEVGPVTGINNHQGSKITMNSEAVETILSFCAENNLHFLDSRTTSESIVPAVAQKLGIQIAERNVFIDNEPSRDSMLHYISTALARAQRYGSAVMIGHTWSEELAPLLTEQIPLFIQQGYNIKTASDIIMKR